VSEARALFDQGFLAAKPIFHSSLLTGDKGLMTMMMTMELQRQQSPKQRRSRRQRTSATRRTLIVLSFLACLMIVSSSGFLVVSPVTNHYNHNHNHHKQQHRERTVKPLFADGSGKPSNTDNKKEDNKNSNNQDVDFLTKASWYAVEWFGKAAAAVKTTDTTKAGGDGDAAAIDTSLPPKSISETIQRIQDDNDRSYFLSGEVDKEIYDPECVFRDPFVAFAGRDRFVENLSNLGSFITNYNARVVQYDRIDETTITTKVRIIIIIIITYILCIIYFSFDFVWILLKNLIFLYSYCYLLFFFLQQPQKPNRSWSNWN
jgi:hypothetical protein